MTPLFVGLLAPAVRLIVPVLFLVVLLYVVSRLVT